MKAKLAFEFQLPEEAERLKTITHAFDTKVGIDDFDEWLRSKVKYGADARADWPSDEDFLDNEEPPLPFNSIVADHIYSLVRERLWETFENFSHLGNNQ